MHWQITLKFLWFEFIKWKYQQTQLTNQRSLDKIQEVVKDTKTTNLRTIRQGLPSPFLLIAPVPRELYFHPFCLWMCAPKGCCISENGHIIMLAEAKLGCLGSQRLHILQQGKPLLWKKNVINLFWELMLIDQCPWTCPCHTPNPQNLELPTFQYVEAWLSHLGATNKVYHHQEGGPES